MEDIKKEIEELRKEVADLKRQLENQPDEIISKLTRGLENAASHTL